MRIKTNFRLSVECLHGHNTVSEISRFCAGHMISVRWPLLCAGPSPRHFCAWVRLCSGPALTTRGRHAQRLVCPTWARHSDRDQPLLRWAHDWPLPCAGPSPRHFCAWVRLCSGPALTTLNSSSVPHGHCPVSEIGHFCAGPYLALGRALATFAPGSDSVAGLPLLRGAATGMSSSHPFS